MTSIDFKLNTGATIPGLALGTWQSPKGAVEVAVEHALTKGGYRHIDCAWAYGNEEEVGRGVAKAIASGKVKREDIFITTKVFPLYHNRVEWSLNDSLKKLGLDYVDLLLFHWPTGLNPKNDSHPLVPRRPDGTRDIDPEFSFQATWKQFETVNKSGKAKAIGVSNCSVPYLKDLLKFAEIPPAANQIESHPLLPQLEVDEFCKEHNIIVEAYSPFGSTGGPLFTNSTVVELSEKYKTTVTAILVSYHLSCGRVALPKTTTPARIDQNATAVELSKEDIEKLDQVHVKEGKKRYTKPDWGVDFKFPDWNAELGNIN